MIPMQGGGFVFFSLLLGGIVDLQYDICSEGIGSNKKNMNGGGFPSQPGAMVLLVQEAQDLDFRAPLCSVNSFIQCVNACFIPYCLLARQQNMLNKGPVDSFRMGPPSGGMPAPMDERKVEEARNRNSDMNGCCAAALVFDIGRIVAAVFVPQIAGSLYFVNGLCLQTFDRRPPTPGKEAIVDSTQWPET